MSSVIISCTSTVFPKAVLLVNQFTSNTLLFNIFRDLNCEDLLNEAAKILLTVRDESKAKGFTIELSWVSVRFLESAFLMFRENGFLSFFKLVFLAKNITKVF